LGGTYIPKHKKKYNNSKKYLTGTKNFLILASEYIFQLLLHNNKYSKTNQAKINGHPGQVLNDKHPPILTEVL
jgi:hypothetical protein